jgi:hypothetical protein
MDRANTYLVSVNQTPLTRRALPLPAPAGTEPPVQLQYQQSHQQGPPTIAPSPPDVAPFQPGPSGPTPQPTPLLHPPAEVKWESAPIEKDENNPWQAVLLKEFAQTLTATTTASDPSASGSLPQPPDTSHEDRVPNLPFSPSPPWPVPPHSSSTVRPQTGAHIESNITHQVYLEDTCDMTLDQASPSAALGSKPETGGQVRPPVDPAPPTMPKHLISRAVRKIPSTRDRKDILNSMKDPSRANVSPEHFFRVLNHPTENSPNYLPLVRTCFLFNLGLTCANSRKQSLDSGKCKPGEICARHRMRRCSKCDGDHTAWCCKIDLATRARDLRVASYPAKHARIPCHNA